MRGLSWIVVAMVAGATAFAGGDDVIARVDGIAPSPVVVRCAKPGAWTFDVRRLPSDTPGVGLVEVRLTASEDAVPPEFSVGCELPQRAPAYFWRPFSEYCGMPPDWRGKTTSYLNSWMPIAAYYAEGDRALVTAATDETTHAVRFEGGLHETGALLKSGFAFFGSPDVTPRRECAVRVRYDARSQPLAEAVRAAATWVHRAVAPDVRVPEACFEPLYSSWYCFHRNVTAEALEAECARAAKLGMRTLIVDDGWQSDDVPYGSSGYAWCGDWKLSKKRFPDMPAHVKRVQAMGMKYMVWYATSFVGVKSENFARFKGKLLTVNEGLRVGILDPRFPEVREHLITTFERALREWGIDGLKLDFVDFFRGGPAATPGDGRDIASVPEATERLMSDAVRRLRAIRPDVMIEFRQPYVGPSMARFGNMLRIGDCAGDFIYNRTGIARLRLTCGPAAVHSDMLEWNAAMSAEAAARNVLNCLFGTIQYSMNLGALPDAHREMIRHWVGFTVAHRGALQKGDFIPHRPELNYPLLEGTDAHERVISVHAAGQTVRVAADGRTAFVVNATDEASLVIDLAAAPRRIVAVDTFGVERGERTAGPGLSRIACPVSGYLRIEWR